MNVTRAISGIVLAAAIVFILVLAAAIQPAAIVASWPTNMVTMQPPRTATPVPPTATPVPPSHDVAKGVVAYPPEPEHICADVAAVGATWYQTGWNLEECPFAGEVGFVQWTQGLQGDGDLLLVWNELDMAGIGTTEAAIRWHDVIEPAYPDRLLAGPGAARWTSNWIPVFWNQYLALYGRPPRLDYVSIHCYSLPGRDCLAEITAAAAWASAHGLETIVSEYAALVYGNPYHCGDGCPDCQTEAAGIAEATRVLNGIKAVPGIVAVAWYNTRTPGDDLGAMDCNSPLVDSAGNLTVFGEFYRDWK